MTKEALTKQKETCDLAGWLHKPDCTCQHRKQVPVTSKNLTPRVVEGMRLRHAEVERASDKLAVARDMAYLSHLDRAELLAECERLTRDLEIQKAVVDLAYIPHRSLSDSRQRADRENERLRAALIVSRKFHVGTGGWLDFEQQREAALSGDSSAPETECYCYERTPG